MTTPRDRPAYLADLGAAAEEIGRLRWQLGALLALADEAPTLPEAQLRLRLLALAAALRSDTPGPARPRGPAVSEE